MSTDPRLGRTIAGYRIEALLGRGGMGVVYRAEHVALHRQVAVKFLPPELAGDEVFRERFLREARLAASIDHPNVLPVYDAEDVGDDLLLVTRLVDGSDLGQLLRDGGRLAPHRALELLGPVAGALDEAHRRGLVHRDVKPGNILIEPSPDGEQPERVYLGDFGLTKELPGAPGSGASPSLTKTGTFVGTPYYAAPEQIEGREIDGRTDQYSLACVLYQALAGEVPYPRPSDTAALVAHLTEPIPPLPEVPGITEPERSSLDAVLARGMAKRREDRFASCTALTRAAGEALLPKADTGEGPGRTVAASPPGTTVGEPATPEEPVAEVETPAGAAVPEAGPGPAEPPPRRGRRTAALVVGGLAAAAAVVVVVVLALGGSGGTPSHSPSNDPFSPAGSLPATIGSNSFVVARQVDGSSDIVVESITGTTIGDLTPGPTDESQPAVSPHRDQVAFVRTEAGNDDIWLMNANGSDAHRITHDPANDDAPAWAGTTIVFESSRSGRPEIYTMDRDGANVQLVRNDPLGDSAPSPSPDGSTIAFVSRPSAGAPTAIFVMPADGSTRRAIASPPGGASAPAFSPDGASVAFASVPQTGARSQIWVVLAGPPSTPSKPGVVQGADATSPSWSPDGARLVFTAVFGSRGETYVINTARRGGPVGSGSDERDPSWAT